MWQNNGTTNATLRCTTKEGLWLNNSTTIMAVGSTIRANANQTYCKFQQRPKLIYCIDFGLAILRKKKTGVNKSAINKCMTQRTNTNTHNGTKH